MIMVLRYKPIMRGYDKQQTHGFDLQLCATEKGSELNKKRKVEAENAVSLLVSCGIVLVDEDIGIVLEDSLDGLEESIGQHTPYR